MTRKPSKLKQRHLDRGLVLVCVIAMAVMGWKSFEAMQYAVETERAMQEIGECEEEKPALRLPPRSIEKPKPKARAI